jgi:hypothetical protein
MHALCVTKKELVLCFHELAVSGETYLLMEMRSRDESFAH